jgi:hypothetical protein
VNGYCLLMAVRDPTRVPVPVEEPIADLETTESARRAHDINWARIAGIVVEARPGVDPSLPNHHERNFILTVAMILTYNVRGVVNIQGLPGAQNFNANVILAIMYYYRQKGRPILRQVFLEGVYEIM